MPDDHLLALRRLLSDGLGGRRYTQACPVLPDVWLAYAAAPGTPQELLLTPDRRGRAAVLARDLRRDVAAWRAADSGRAGRDPPRIANVPDLVAAALYFDELLAVALPKTRWWSKAVRSPAAGDADSVPLSDDKRKAIATAIGEAKRQASESGGAIPKEQAWSHDFLWLVAITGSIRLRLRKRPPRDPSDRQLVDAFGELFPRGLPAAESPGDDIPWRISCNRPVDLAAEPMESVLAIKADAARRLFDISCDRVTWAILDSGIDREHPAFRDWSREAPAAGPPPNRVDRTYDFTVLRDLLDPAAMAQLAQARAGLSAERKRLRDRLELNLVEMDLEPGPRGVGRYARQLQRRLSDGLDIDWGSLEPFLLETQPDPPVSGHGTHVAGVLAADWRKPREGAADPAAPTDIEMQGVCPDIRLYDMRVLRSGDTVAEFEVIAALQFIGHLNRRADSQLVHGANLSIETPHNVDNYACGSTPVCETCDRLWASGVVLVAAAGNRGHARYQLASGEPLGGYLSISITDPGNAEGVITVGSTHARAHRYGVSYFSSRGPTGDGRRKPDLVAPGEQVAGPAPGGGQSIANGTSFAAPHVSGAAALLMARFAELRGEPERIKAILCGTATDLGREPYFQGAGMVDVLRALQSI